MREVSAISSTPVGCTDAGRLGRGQIATCAPVLPRMYKARDGVVVLAELESLAAFSSVLLFPETHDLSTPTPVVALRLDERSRRKVEELADGGRAQLHLHGFLQRAQGEKVLIASYSPSAGIDWRSWLGSCDDIAPPGLVDFAAELLVAGGTVERPEYDVSTTATWDAVWHPEAVDTYGRSDLRFHAARRKLILFPKLGIGFAPGERVVEVGCGDARLVVELAAAYGIEPWGVDFSPEALRRAAANGAVRHVTFEGVLADVRNTGLPDNSFDKLISLGLIEHFNSPEVVLAEHYRLLKSGGILIMQTPNRRSFGVIDRKLQERLGIWAFGYQTEYSPCDLAQLASAAGFRTLASLSTHCALRGEKWNLALAGVIDRLGGVFRSDTGFNSWYIGVKP